MTPRLCLTYFALVLFSCGEVSEQKSSLADSTTFENRSVNEFEDKRQNDTIFKSDDTLIIHFTYDRTDTLLKFTTDLENKIYFVTPEKVDHTPRLDFSRYEYKYLYITTTKYSVKEDGVNFAGHFCFAYWGCGSNCKMGAVIDMKTGIVYNGINASSGYRFKKDSKILVVNPPDSFGWYNQNIIYDIPEEYMWTGKEFRLIKTAANSALTPPGH